MLHEPSGADRSELDAKFKKNVLCPIFMWLQIQCPHTIAAGPCLQVLWTLLNQGVVGSKGR